MQSSFIQLKLQQFFHILTKKITPRRCEYLTVAFIAAAFFIFAYHLFIIQKRMFTHDTIWYYGLMHYFYNSVMQGVFPYWDPYNYCGQPIYYNLGLAHVFEIPTMLLIYANKIVHGSLFDLYHVDFILRLLFTALGVYLAYRQTTRFIVSRLVVFVSFLLSSFTFATMFQPGLLTSFSWTPWAVWFFLRLRERFDLYNIVGFSLFLGLSLGGYQAGYPLTFFSIIIVLLLFIDRHWVFGVASDKKKSILCAVGFFIVASLSSHLIPVFMEKDRVLPVMRQVDDPSKSRIELASVDIVNAGAHSKVNDFMGLGIADVAAHSWTERQSQAGSFSEGPLYIGMLPLLFAFIGALFSRHKEHRLFLILLASIVFLMLNIHIKLGPGMFFIFPFLRYCRHMQLFQPFFIFVLMYFVGQGCDSVMCFYQSKKEGRGCT